MNTITGMFLSTSRLEIHRRTSKPLPSGSGKIQHDQVGDRVVSTVILVCRPFPSEMSASPLASESYLNAGSAEAAGDDCLDQTDVIGIVFNDEDV